MADIPAEAVSARPVSPAGRSAGDGRVPLARAALPLAGVLGIYGIYTSFMSSTASLFLADAVRASPFLIGLFFAVRGAAAIAVNQAAGRMSDRSLDRRLLLAIAGAGGALAGLSMAVLRGYLPVLLTGAVFFSVAGLTFAQVFAYASELARERGRSVTAFTAWIRAAFSAAWVLGPPVGLLVVARYGFEPLYLGAAALSLASGLLGRWGLAALPGPDRPAAGPAPGAGRLAALGWRLWLLLAVVVLLGVVNQMYSIDIALYVTRDLHLSAEVVGWAAGSGAVLEIPVMIVAAKVADRVGASRVVLGAAAAAVAFFCLLPLARSVAALLALQVLNAAWTAVAMSIPMVMIQQEAPGGAGASSSLYSSGFLAAGVLAGAVTGVSAQVVGYAGVFWVCAVLSALALALLAARMLAGRAAGAAGPASDVILPG